MTQEKPYTTHLGKIIDVDAHEMIPTHMWGDCFGPAARALAPMAEMLLADNGDNNLKTPDVLADDREATSESVWRSKGPRAPGAISPKRRLEVLDVMGVRRQLIFPTGVGFAGMLFESVPREVVAGMFGPALADQPIGRVMAEEYNQWAIRFQAEVGERVRPGGVLLTGDVKQAIADAERLLAAGLRVVVISTNVPPGGVSPADARLDPLWGLLAKANVPVMAHVNGSERDFLKTSVWGEGVPAFERNKNRSIEFDRDPYSLSTFHFGVQNYLTAMVLGGVFERHPTLRFGAGELGASWVGPLADNLDLWASQFKGNLAGRLSMRPSEYINRNVRVAPYFFEPVDRYIERFGLEDVYCFSTDFPHVEGGKAPMDDFGARLARLGSTVVEKFFVKNGELLLPPA